MRNVIVIDFDGTIAEWGEYPVPGPPCKGVKEGLTRLKDIGFYLIVASARTSDEVNEHPMDKMEEKIRMERYMDEHDIPYDEVRISDKPPAKFYIDDRSVSFGGDWAEVLEKVGNRLGDGYGYG